MAIARMAAGNQIFPGRSASPGTRHYVIERELTTMVELEALIADYRRESQMWDAIPAAGPCCLLADLREQER